MTLTKSSSPSSIYEYSEGFRQSVLVGKLMIIRSPKTVFSQVETLHKIGLAAPETVELCHSLNEQGFALSLDRLNAEECAQALYEVLKA
jgi:energy-coupling factor transport system ATP-binding protein